MGGSKSTDGRDDVHTHLCLRCYYAYDCASVKCTHIVKCEMPECIAVDGENHFHQESIPEKMEVYHKCKFCKSLTEEQCAILRKPEHYLIYHRGWESKKIAEKIAKLLNIAIPKKYLNNYVLK